MITKRLHLRKGEYMKSIVILALGLMPLAAQVNSSVRVVDSAPTGACQNNERMRILVTNGHMYRCSSGSWVDITPAGSAAAWGGITGTLSSQTDLQTALDGKAATSIPVLTTTSVAGLSAEANLGALTDNNIVAVDVSAGTATPRAATYSDVVALWTGCSGYLKNNGTCDTGAGGGTTPSRSTLFLSEEFISGNLTNGTVGQLGWATSSDIGSGSVSGLSIAGHPGIIRVNSGTTTNDRMRLLSGGTYYGDLTSGAWEAVFVFRLSGATTNVVAVVGFTTEYDYCGLSGRDCIAMKFDAATDTNWQIRSYSSTTNQSGSPCDTGIAPNTTDWITLRLTGAGSSSITAGWRVNGGAESTCVVTLSTANVTNFSPIFAVQTTNGTAKQIDADFFSYTRTGLTSR